MDFKKKEFEKEFYSNLKLLEYKFPFLPSIISKLSEQNIIYGLFGGTVVWLLTSSRETTDLDLLVADEDFEKMKSLFPDAKIEHKDYGDFICLEDDSVELGFNLNPGPEERSYRFRLTDIVNKKRENFSLGDSEIYLLNPVDTILLKAILQRGANEGKHDFEDIANIVNKLKINKEYLNERFEECRCDERVRRCLKSFNLLW